MRNRLLILAISSLVTLPGGFIYGYVQFTLPTLISQGFEPAVVTSFVTTAQLASIILNPLMLFIVMYVVGRGMDLSSSYGRVLLSLFLGALAGDFVGFSASYLGSPTVHVELTLSAVLVLHSVEVAIPAVFTGFTAASLAFFGRASGSRAAKTQSPP